MDKGALYSVSRKLKRPLRIVFGRTFLYETIFVFTVKTSKVPLKQLKEVKVRLLQSNELPKLNELKGPETRKAEERLKAGDLCLVGEKNGDIVHYEWICLSEILVKSLERRIRIMSGYAYVYDGYTVPQHRNKGISAAVLTNAANYLSQKGIEEMYVVIGPNNYASLRTWHKIGPRKQGQITLIKLFNSTVYKCKAETAENYLKLRKLLAL